MRTEGSVRHPVAISIETYTRYTPYEKMTFGDVID